MIADFHFIRPLWLLSIPVLLTIWWVGAQAFRSSLWENHIPKNMIEALRVNKAGKSTNWRWTLLAAWLLLALAMAGPSWHKTPLPTLTNQQALVLTLDLSPSMMAKDLAPDRLTRAKYKMIDILRLRSDSQVALVAYAGDAHTVSPLTDDPATIEALLSSLSPSMMPSAGSNTEAAIELAKELLNQASVLNGEILLITDGVASDAQTTLRANHGSQHIVSVLALGSESGAPIPAANGGFLKSANGDIVLAGVNHGELAALARDLGGRYTALQNDESDIQYLLKTNPDFNDQQVESDSVVYDSWVDMGHWLVLLMLPFALYFFRKGLVFVLPLFLFQPLDSQAAWYDQLSWQDLWETRNQQANKLMQEEQYEQAAEKFKDPDWAAVAHYRNGQYEQASTRFEHEKNATNLYNMANSLALEGDLENAIEAYEQVIEQAPQHDDAIHNLAIVEQLLGQNQKQSEKQESQESDEQSEQQDGEASEQPPQESQNPQQSESGETQQGDNQESDQQQAQAQQQENQEAEEQEQEQSEQQQSQQESESEQESPEQLAEQQEQESNSEQQAEAQAEDSQAQDEALDGPVRDQQEPLQDSSEQWLRTIQDDPSGLLKRKFEYQAWQRSRQGARSNRPSAQKQQRY